ncbi:PLP-dependent transferase, partial [Viridothelium virens]
IEKIRKNEYPLLREQTYLDHAGTTLYAKTLIERFSKDLNSHIYGNPHSDSTPSALSGARIDKVRERALRFFNASPDEFDLVFVANATAAIKIVADAFRDISSNPGNIETPTGFWYGWHRDAHTSLVGIREVNSGSNRFFHSDEDVQRWIDGGCNGQDSPLGLFAYPGQSNMTGRRLPLKWPGEIRATQAAHSASNQIYTLLDAAALSTTRPLDFGDSSAAPDFTALSFYKIFGFPDLGALIVRKASAHLLTHGRRYFGGGTVEMVISQPAAAEWHAKKQTQPHASLEDGTLPFHSIIALDHALDTHAALFGSMALVSAHTAHLVRELHARLTALRHASPEGAPVVRVYNDEGAVYGGAVTQGATVAFNVLRADGTVVGYADVERAADKEGIAVRSGSLCNPGGMAGYLEWGAGEMREAYANGHRCSDPVQLVDGKPTGVVRVSLGAMSTMRDVKRWVEFVEGRY